MAMHSWSDIASLLANVYKKHSPQLACVATSYQNADETNTTWIQHHFKALPAKEGKACTFYHMC